MEGILQPQQGVLLEGNDLILPEVQCILQIRAMPHTLIQAGSNRSTIPCKTGAVHNSNATMFKGEEHKGNPKGVPDNPEEVHKDVLTRGEANLDKDFLLLQP